MRQRLRPAFSTTGAPNIIFWFCLFALNSLLFLPSYILNLDTSTFLPLTGQWGESVSTLITRLTVWRENLDLFRINVELILLLALWVNVRWLRWRRFPCFFALVYLVALIYYIYESVMVSLFFVDPVFYSQYRMLTEGVQFLFQHMQVPWRIYVVALILLGGGGLLVFTLIRTLTRPTLVDGLSRWSQIVIATLAALALLATARYQVWSASPEMPVSSLFYKVQKNVNESLAVYHDIAQFDDALIRNAYDYTGKTLDERPNIYLIFIESYGSVLYKRPDWRVQYPLLLMGLDRQLKAGGWHVASNLSTATQWGGGSWMTYTSALFGLRIDDDPEFAALFERYQNAVYPDLGGYLQSQGYRNVRLSSIASKIRESKWAQYEKFYHTDQWFRYRDFDYKGARYGWGPAPPDQFALNFARERLTDKKLGKAAEQPFMLFFITQNSHYPFALLPAVVDDWRTLNTPAPDPEPPDLELIAHELRRQNYFNSIKYELEFLTDFILQNKDENAVFVLVGDHQPPRVSRRNDGWETPMHIISRDADFVASFADYGFVDGLRVRNLEKAVKHEGFYSMFVRQLLAHYGEDPTNLPAYLPDGVVMPTTNRAADEPEQPISPLN